MNKLMEQLKEENARLEGLLNYCKENFIEGAHYIIQAQCPILRLLLKLETEELKRLLDK